MTESLLYDTIEAGTPASETESGVLAPPQRVTPEMVTQEVWFWMRASSPERIGDTHDAALLALVGEHKLHSAGS